MSIIVIIGVALGLFLFFRLVNLAVKRVLGGRPMGGNYLIFRTISEFVVWVYFYFWAMDRLLSGKSYYTTLLVVSVLIILLFFAWYIFRDVFAGVLFKVQYRPSLGQHFYVKEMGGVLKRIGTTSLTLLTTEGDELNIPYSKIISTVTGNTQKKVHDDASIKLLMAKKLSKEDTLNKLRESLLNSPWNPVKKPPVIKVLSESDTHYEFEITLGTTNASHLARIEERLKKEV